MDAACREAAVAASPLMPPLDYHVLVPHTWTDGYISAAGIADASEIRPNYEYKCEVKQSSVAGVWSAGVLRRLDLRPDGASRRLDRRGRLTLRR